MVVFSVPLSIWIQRGTPTPINVSENVMNTINILFTNFSLTKYIQIFGTLTVNFIHKVHEVWSHHSRISVGRCYPKPKNAARKSRKKIMALIIITKNHPTFQNFIHKCGWCPALNANKNLKRDSRPTSLQYPSPSTPSHPHPNLTSYASHYPNLTI